MQNVVIMTGFIAGPSVAVKPQSTDLVSPSEQRKRLRKDLIKHVAMERSDDAGKIHTVSSICRNQPPIAVAGKQN